MAAAPTPIEAKPEPTPPWRDVFKDKALIISLTVIWQFFALIVIFSQWPSKTMDPQAKMIILQTFVVAFSLAYGYWIGASDKEKTKPPPAPPAV